MKHNAAEDRFYFAARDAALLDEETASQADKFSHARVLRTIGHALGSHRVVTCDLSVENEIYTVKGTALPTKRLRQGLFRSVRKLFVKASISPLPDFITNRIELRYSMADIRALDAQVRDRRSASPEVPDPLSMSQLLRVIGGFMDKRAGEELLGVSIDDRWVTITHVSRDSRLLKTSHDIEYFYDLWVKMYLQRSNRLCAPPPSGPTVCIAGGRLASGLSYPR
ncbi:MAG: hypothetical protein ACREOR_08025 [Candidatus Binatia bacterium]